MTISGPLNVTDGGGLPSTAGVPSNYVLGVDASGVPQWESPGLGGGSGSAYVNTFDATTVEFRDAGDDSLIGYGRVTEDPTP